MYAGILIVGGPIYLREATNENLKIAKSQKKDEFYTTLSDIENELKHYKHHFRDKIVYCNCDDPRVSNFFKYFVFNFEELGLKKLITTSYGNNQIALLDRNDYGRPILFEYNGEYNKIKNIIDRKKIRFNYLEGDGDFRSQECIGLLKKSDIVVTNPPFSLFRQYVNQLIEYKKKFLIIGTWNAISYKEIFKLIKNNQCWTGINRNRNFSGFILPKHYSMHGTEARLDKDGNRIVSSNNTCWYTNLYNYKRDYSLILHKQYKPEEYPEYENYDAINIDKVNDIPKDYKGKMGVPITFIDKYNPSQFSIIALGIVGSIEFKNNRKMEILDKKTGVNTGKHTYNAKGTLYRKYNPKKDRYFAFRDFYTGELYSSIYARLIIIRRK